jgi:guanine deaminase
VPGKEFDALIIDPTREDPFDVFEASPLEIFEKFIYLGDDRNITQIFVKGREIKC